jgi:hypothetical protein
VYLHDVRHSDEDRAFHDHPWENTSILIYGTYVEHTPDGIFTRHAGDIVSRSARSLHRLEIIPGNAAVSLFITGPKVREWGFQCPQGWVHWRDFTDPNDKALTGRGCGEMDTPTPTTTSGALRDLTSEQRTQLCLF